MDGVAGRFLFSQKEERVGAVGLQVGGSNYTLTSHYAMHVHVHAYADFYHLQYIYCIQTVQSPKVCSSFFSLLKIESRHQILLEIKTQEIARRPHR